ncbi:hypothetical protein A3A14_02025 [Candidatus Daviesbacteria bacterium RIFCSPLOWO2_01_FULL_43_38]|uniref:Uncharacterized protein n=3 Tax=Candidatus Daviesiibacteriota TaxID=1752718 RepID=A0A1F5K821_9BACT|nr:MAG: hypothetical protein UV33_C0026G0011 [Candidatus Daviesbacteria bacterium GW2011_GWA1_42_6]KKS70523.1 MAG: hypothetical protein UV41_C0020G0002 [Candidatus Daviesbacteria bacterium GW2011_GWA2_42_7]OGE19829.1 MAG: hypothetical protein A2874_02785 [Candidatus Daviesbacteria bacterium RIFCSPHIGHO2_01_FULL_43_17]OGE36975.1 MAG: hypothetical protein A3E45_01900 [Candidatus Daviesbacteria bacterium RIFCSPHIGHO2_12_FULL_43_11]OGE63632.1 MAG: hypothetical protein A3A14_02025 [Candidatus Davies
MATDKSTVEVQPGVDNNAHIEATNQKVAEAVSAISSTPVPSAQLTPPALQQPNIPEASPESSGIQIDWGEHVDAEMGKSPVLTEPNKGILGIFKDMLRKKNPGKVIEPEK